MDSILKRYPQHLSLEEQARLGCMPDTLTIGQIAELWAKGDAQKTSSLGNAIRQAAIDGKLKCKGDPGPSVRREPIRSKWDVYATRCRCITVMDDGLSAEITRDDFKAWLADVGESESALKVPILAAWLLQESGQEISTKWWRRKCSEHSNSLSSSLDEKNSTKAKGGSIQAARELLEKIKELWSLIRAGSDDPLKLRSKDDLQQCALDVLREAPAKWHPITEQHLKNPSLYNTAPERAARTFRENLCCLVYVNLNVSRVRALIKASNHPRTIPEQK